MNYIDSEVFMGASSNVQDSLLKWYKADDYDQIYDKRNAVYSVLIPSTDDDIYAYAGFPYDKRYKILKEDIVPLFDEAQLRQFIEEKTGGLIQVQTAMRLCGDKEYRIRVKVNGEPYDVTDDVVATDLLQGYWTIVCAIIEEM